MSYFWLKLVHIIALVLWLGPAIGAYWLLLRLKDASHTTAIALERLYEQVLLLEHAAFLFLLTSGYLMARAAGIAIFATPWLVTKLAFVAGIVLIEIFDIALSHVYFRRLFVGSTPPSVAHWQRFLKLRNRFYMISIPLLVVLITGALIQAVLKFY